MPIPVRDVMTPDVVTVPESAEFKEVAGLLAAYRVGALPVLNPVGHVVGIISESDLLLKQEYPHAAETARLIEPGRLRGERHRAEGRTAGMIMNAPAITVAPTTTVTQAARLMHAEGIKHLPVVDVDGGLVGIVSRADLIRVFLRDDEAILAELRELLAAQSDVDPGRVTVTVSEGVVTLRGRVERRGAATTLALLARELDGVVGVDDRLDTEVDGRGTPSSMT
jgi:CBS domain-containing protein